VPLLPGPWIGIDGDKAGAEAEYVKASALDPSDPHTHIGLGNIREKEKNYDAALEEFQMAERLAPAVGQTHADIGRVLPAKKDVPGAIEELKQAECVRPYVKHVKIPTSRIQREKGGHPAFASTYIPVNP
jgi:tetratricopeptide (TPR) repeat protein